MSNKILVAYASRTGSTVGVAEAIGKTLTEHGLTVDVFPMQDVRDLAPYRAVLIGSAVQNGKWLVEAVNFVKANQPALNCIPVALFCVHIQNLGDDETSRQKRLAYLDEIRPLLQPLAEVFFAGRFDRHGAALLFPGLLARVIPSMDFRDWKKIRAWADSIHPLLLQSG